MIDLDLPASHAVDASGMWEHMARLGPELERAWSKSEGFPGRGQCEDVDGMVIAGMGGSAAAGDYVAALSESCSSTPVAVVRAYDLPAYVSHSTLVVVASYSGETEEALAMYRAGRDRGARLAVVTHGGKLGGMARADGVPVFRVDYDAAPRAAFAHGLAPLLRAAQGAAALDLRETAIAEAAARHQALMSGALGRETVTANNPAKRIAAGIEGSTPLVLSAGHLAPAGDRLKNQLAENSKVLAAAERLPEAGHNLIVGLGGPPPLLPWAVVSLESTSYHPRVGAQFEAATEFFARRGLRVFRVDVSGRSPLEELLAATAWGDAISYYLAIGRGIDPTPIPEIHELKRALREDPAAVVPR